MVPVPSLHAGPNMMVRVSRDDASRFHTCQPVDHFESVLDLQDVALLVVQPFSRLGFLLESFAHLFPLVLALLRLQVLCNRTGEVR